MNDKLLAQVETPIGQLCGKYLGPFGELCGSESGLVSIGRLISVVIGMMTIVAALFFMFQFMLGGFNWISAAGDKNKLQIAQERITNGLMGLIIVVAAYGVMAIIASVLGFDFLNLEGLAGFLQL